MPPWNSVCWSGWIARTRALGMRTPSARHRSQNFSTNALPGSWKLASHWLFSPMKWLPQQTNEAPPVLAGAGGGAATGSAAASSCCCGTSSRASSSSSGCDSGSCVAVSIASVVRSPAVSCAISTRGPQQDVLRPQT
eukprot:6664184-Prymnesium_polylepis.1